VGLFFYIAITITITKPNQLKDRNYSTYDKKQVIFKSPDLNKLQVVVIDHRTKIYISPDADPEEARNRYLSRNNTRRT